MKQFLRILLPVVVLCFIYACAAGVEKNAGISFGFFIGAFCVVCYMCHLEMKPVPFSTTHKLIPALKTDYGGPNKYLIELGTIQALYEEKDSCLDVHYVENSDKGNGHFTDFMQHMEHECKLKSKSLFMRTGINSRLFTHLVDERGYKGHSGLLAIKKF
jgi:hypothetical protein